MAPAAIHTKCAKAVDKAVENYSAGLAGRLIQHIASNLSSATMHEGAITVSKKNRAAVRGPACISIRADELFTAPTRP